MRKLVVGSFLTLDGVQQGPGAPSEDRENGFEHGGWVVPFFDDQLGQYMNDLISRAGALLLGRKTYDIFAASWPLTGDDDPIGSVYNRIPKYVASRTLTSAAWKGTTILNGDVAAEVAKLKEEDGGEIQVAGSGELVQTLLKHDLVDEFHLLTFPVLIGSGKRLFGAGAIPRGLKLISTTTTSPGVTISTYERQGALEYGEVGVEFEQNQ